jgi:predicted esterase
MVVMLLVLASPFVAIGVFMLIRLRVPQARPKMPAIGASSEPAPESTADWCAPGFEPVPGGGCFASFADHAGQPLIVYLHGRYARDVAADEIDRQRRLGARATARGYAVLALRGRLGECVALELADWFCWPSNDKNLDHAPEFVGSWTQALAAAHERTGSQTRFLLGFSNGGYFAGLIASRRLLPIQAVAVAHGGPVVQAQAVGGDSPFLLLSADDDVAQDDMIRLEEQLARAQWPHDSYARFGGHALTDEDIDAALTFFARAKERLPLDPPLPLHRPVRHERDAGVESDSAETVEPDLLTAPAPVPPTATPTADPDLAPAPTLDPDPQP